MPAIPSVQIKDTEARSLEFFHHVVAPAISGQIDSSFWTRLVLQAGSDVPAVRHATIAISSLYENFGSSTAKPNQLAVRHYNHAIKDIMSTSDEQTVLLVCILFICIEFLRGDVSGAIDHCGHGVSILNNALANPRSTIRRDDLLDIFCRLGVFPFFFGSTPHTFPLLAGLELPSPPTPQSIPTFSQIQRSLDILVCRAIRLIRTGDDYRLGTSQQTEIPGHLLTEQLQVEQQLFQWRKSFLQLRSAKITPPEERLSHIALEMKHIVAKVWISNAFDPDEGAYDAHAEDFKHVVTLASHVPRTKQDNLEHAKFRFEMGFTPLLYFVAIKCRLLDTRLEALRFMNELAVRRENLWDADILNAVARRVIELEHGLSLDEMVMQSVGERKGAQPVPSSSFRIMDTVTNPNEEYRDGATARRVTFFLAGEDGGVRVAREWVMM